VTVDAVPLGPASTIDDLVKQWQAEILKGAAVSTDGQMTSASYRTIGTTLRRRIWDPLAAHLGGMDRVFIVPDGSINIVAFDALPTAQGKYLIESGPVIHYLSAERDVVASRESAPVGNGLLAVGGAAFDNATPSRSIAPAAPSTTRSGCGSPQILHFDPLPGTRREAGEIAELWKNNTPTGQDEESTVLNGRDATEDQVKRRAPGHRVLHLATHGFFLGNGCGPAIPATRSVGGLASTQPNRPRQDTEDNPLILSGLALAGANRRTATRVNEDDGILTAEEVTALNLKGVEWAVLSACDTGLGELKAGEGVLGLRRAFQIAGAHTIIMSLWSVADQSTRNWMRALYEGRLERHLSTADAVHDASLRMLQSRRAAGQSTHPFFWAAFVAAGDWK
jgi:CHAT domain-containing protein